MPIIYCHIDKLLLCCLIFNCKCLRYNIKNGKIDFMSEVTFDQLLHTGFFQSLIDLCDKS